MNFFTRKIGNNQIVVIQFDQIFMLVCFYTRDFIFSPKIQKYKRKKMKVSEMDSIFTFSGLWFCELSRRFTSINCSK